VVVELEEDECIDSVTLYGHLNINNQRVYQK